MSYFFWTYFTSINIKGKISGTLSLYDLTKNKTLNISSSYIIPYIIDKDVEIPDEFRERLYLTATDNQKDDFEKLSHAIIQYANKRNNQILKEQEAANRINNSLTTYLSNVFERLEHNRIYYRNLGIGAYLISALFLILAVLDTFYMTKQRITEIDTAIFVFGAGVVLTCILAALSRMMFILGRSFMVESIRNADRYHAISFGKFYMQAFENNLSKQEVKEVLGSWNFESETSFSKQDAKEIDPNIMSIFEKSNLSFKI